MIKLANEEVIIISCDEMPHELLKELNVDEDQTIISAIVFCSDKKVKEK